MRSSEIGARLRSSPLLLKELQSFAPAYYGAVTRELYSEKVSGDVLAAAYAEMAKEISEFDPKHSSLFAWGYRVVRRNVSRRKTEMVLQEIFGCADPAAYRKHREKLQVAGV